MKAFETLTERGQVHRIKQMARTALAEYALDVESLSLIYHGENTTFRAVVKPDATLLPKMAHLSPTSLLVRCHRPNYNTAKEIQSELVWLDALAQSGVPVQNPVLNNAGEHVTFVQDENVPDPRFCTVMRWVEGRFFKKPKPLHFERLGILTARLHEHVRTWDHDETFSRRTWDSQNLFGDIHRQPHDESIWLAFSDKQREIVEEAMAHTNDAFETLEASKRKKTLIHHDLHFGNVIFRGEQAIPIDFDDCGFAYPIQDIATSLSYRDGKPNFETYKDALLKGYTSTGADEPAMQYLYSFIIARHAQMALWLVDRSRDVPKYRAELSGWLERNANMLESLLKKA